MNNRKDTEQSTLTISKLLQANAILAVLKTAAVLPTQPLQVVMRNQQSGLKKSKEPQLLSARQVAWNIATQNGEPLSLRAVPFFFRGTLSGLTKEFLKNASYKGALILGAPKLADTALKQTTLADILPQNLYRITQVILASSIAGASDVLLGGPLDALATFHATSQGKHADASYAKEVRAEPTLSKKIQRIYRGSDAAILKSTIGFVAYFSISQHAKQWAAHLYGIENEKALPWYGKLTASLISGGTVAAASSPFDIVKTQLQMPNPSNLGLGNALVNNFKQHGIKGITTGLPLKCAMITLGWGINDLGVNLVAETITERRSMRPGM